MTPVLVDTNILVEIIFNQENAEEAKLLLGSPKVLPQLTDFALHSICVRFCRRKGYVGFLRWMGESYPSLRIVHVPNAELPETIQLAEQYAIDLDDAYQLQAAKRYKLEFVTFDAHFNRTTPRGIHPGDYLRQLQEQNELQ